MENTIETLDIEVSNYSSRKDINLSETIKNDVIKVERLVKEVISQFNIDIENNENNTQHLEKEISDTLEKYKNPKVAELIALPFSKIPEAEIEMGNPLSSILENSTYLKENPFKPEHIDNPIHEYIGKLEMCKLKSQMDNCWDSYNEIRWDTSVSDEERDRIHDKSYTEEKEIREKIKELNRSLDNYFEETQKNAVEIGIEKMPLSSNEQQLKELIVDAFKLEMQPKEERNQEALDTAQGKLKQFIETTDIDELCKHLQKYDNSVLDRLSVNIQLQQKNILESLSGGKIESPTEYIAARIEKSSVYNKMLNTIEEGKEPTPSDDEKLQNYRTLIKNYEKENKLDNSIGYGEMQELKDKVFITFVVDENLKERSFETVDAKSIDRIEEMAWKNNIVLRLASYLIEKATLLSLAFKNKNLTENLIKESGGEMVLEKGVLKNALQPEVKIENKVLKYEGIDLSKLEKIGLSKDKLEKLGVLNDLLEGRETKKIDCVYESKTATYSFQGRLKIVENEGKIQINILEGERKLDQNVEVKVNQKQEPKVETKKEWQKDLEEFNNIRELASGRYEELIFKYKNEPKITEAQTHIILSNNINTEALMLSNTVEALLETDYGKKVGVDYRTDFENVNNPLPIHKIVAFVLNETLSRDIYENQQIISEIKNEREEISGYSSEREKENAIEKYKNVLKEKEERIQNIEGFLNNPKEQVELKRYSELLNQEITPNAVGKIHFLGSEGKRAETLEYDNVKSYLDAIRKQYDYNSGGFELETIIDSPEIKKAVDDIIYGAYGVDNPNDIESYSKKEEKIKNDIAPSVEKDTITVKTKEMKHELTDKERDSSQSLSKETKDRKRGRKI